jgi:2-polyprenyl-3-methyl-5-hydroxy-6-metoxy-1,4-benzoquinol methylase
MIVKNTNRQSLKDYLIECSKCIDFDIDHAFDVTINFIKFHKGINVNLSSIQEMKNLEEQWYNSLKANQPNYSVYSDPYYFCEVWLCWINYSSRYLKDICKSKSLFNKSIVDDMKNVKVVVDLGCGFGYTTAALKEIFTQSIVYGTNIKESSQYKMAEKCGKKYNFSVINDIDGIKSDLIFASEYFEHFERPIEHLEYILQKLNPRYLLIANTFNGKAIGHFDYYKHYDTVYPGKKMNLLFNDYMRKYGYKKIKTNCWNNRPTYWKKENIETLDKYFQ